MTCHVCHEDTEKRDPMWSLVVMAKRHTARYDAERRAGVPNMVRIYVAGPYTHGDVAMNVRKAIAAGDELARHGFAPFIPHLSHFWHLLFPHEYQFWLDLDREWLPTCAAMLLLPGESPGARLELQWALALDIPVFQSIRAIAEHFA